MNIGTDLIRDIETRFRALGCKAAMVVRDLATGAEIAHRPDTPMVAASVFKALVASTTFREFHAGRLDGALTVSVAPANATPGPTGLSLLRHPARFSLLDLVTSMMTISDNAATDIALAHVGLDAVNAHAAALGCRDTVIVSGLAALLNGVGRDLGFADYATLLAAQSGEQGEEALGRSRDQSRIAACGALDPARTTRTTAADMVRFLAAIWTDPADPPWHHDLRALMSRQVPPRLEGATPDGGTLAAKSGGLFGRVRNEIAVIGHPDGRLYAAAIFTDAAQAFANTAAINAGMADAVREAIACLRR